MASVPAPAAMRKPQSRSRYQNRFVAKWSLNPTASQ